MKPRSVKSCSSHGQSPGVHSGGSPKQETPEESYYRRNLGQVSHVQAMDKTQESIVVAALSRKPLKSLIIDET